MGMLDGKVAIVTGAGRGIGRAHAQLLASEGASVLVNDLDPDAEQVVDEIVASGGNAVANHDNVATWDGAGSLVAHALDAFETLDVLVNNAGILRDAMSFNITEEQWDSVIAVHLKGHVAPCHHAVKYWRERSKAGEPVSGRIISTASESGLYGQAGQVNYATAKAGIVAMTTVIAREMKKYGVTANVVCPRARTRMTESVPGASDFMTGTEWDPEQIAPMVAFLASDSAHDVSGQVFVVWGTRVHLMQGWQLAATLDRGEGRWTPQELVDRIGELFAGRSSKIPPLGFGE
jgi:NAD(P)-dependent dehydrogenase (short-subunit alcohol dehydrogenase family)